MSKFIIKNESKLKDSDAISCAQLVVERGKVSAAGECYCYATIFNTAIGEVVVYATKNKSSDTFVIRDNPHG